jgi:co-chaperonin GroES (HSP10)
MAELKLLDDNVLLIPQTMEKTQSGIILSKNAQSQEMKIMCTISVVGPEVQNKDLQEGITVIIPKRTGKWVKFEGFKYILVKESDILCIVEGIKIVKEEDKEKYINE